MASNPYPDKECTWGVGRRVNSQLKISLPSWGNAENGFSNAKKDGYSTGSISGAKPGDILCGGHRYNPDTVGHVQYVERDDGDTLYVSESYATLSDPPAYVSISKSNPTYGRGDGFPFQGVIFLKGEDPPGPDPPGPGPDPPGPDPGGRGEYDHTEYIEVGKLEPEKIKILCDDQQNPSTPSPEEIAASHGIYPSDEYRDIRGDGLNYYTDERQIHYNPKSIGLGEEDGQEISDKEFVMNWSD